jgi:hypothetical protein
MAWFCLHSSHLSHLTYRYGFSFFLISICNFWLLTKRESFLADLPSLRDLRMASEQDLDTHMEPVSGYTTVTPAIRMPASDDTSTFTAPHFTTRSELQPNQYRQRTVHTTTFKIFEHGKEVDDTGYLKIKTPETFNDLQPHCRSCSRSSRATCGWLCTNSHFGQLLAKIIQYERKHMAIP